MKARLAAAGLFPLGEPSGPPAPPDREEEPVSARVTAARARARERQDRQRQLLRPLGWALIAIVVTVGLNSRPAPGLTGARLGVSVALALYAVAVATTVVGAWVRRGNAIHVALIGVIGGCGVALAALQPHGPAEVAASVAVWIAAVRLPLLPGLAVGGVITGALALTIALTEQPAAQSALYAVLLCLLLAVTGQFIRRGREAQDRTELLMAQLQDAREAEAAAAALAERSRIAGELHDVLAHALSGLAIQLQGARKLAERESASAGLRGALERSAELAREGLADARQAVGALRGDRLPTVDQVGALVEDFRRDTGGEATLRIDGTPRALPADASLALFRGAQEALTNIARYAPGATVAITVRYGTGHTALAVEDRRCPFVATGARDAASEAAGGAAPGTAGGAAAGVTEGEEASVGVIGADGEAAGSDAGTVGRDAGMTGRDADASGPEAGTASGEARTAGGDAGMTGRDADASGPEAGTASGEARTAGGDAGMTGRDADASGPEAGTASGEARTAGGDAGMTGRDADASGPEAGTASGEARTAGGDAGMIGRDADASGPDAGAEADTRTVGRDAGTASRDARTAGRDARTAGRDARTAGGDAGAAGGDAGAAGALRVTEADRPLLAEAGGGHGLTAMRERTARAGGAARAGPTADGWLVELEVPG